MDYNYCNFVIKVDTYLWDNSNIAWAEYEWIKNDLKEGFRE